MSAWCDHRDDIHRLSAYAGAHIPSCVFHAKPDIVWLCPDCRRNRFAVVIEDTTAFDHGECSRHLQTGANRLGDLLGGLHQNLAATRMKPSDLAERAGFEPAEPCGSPDFESGTFDHSATSPGGLHDRCLAASIVSDRARDSAPESPSTNSAHSNPRASAQSRTRSVIPASCGGFNRVVQT